MLEVYRQMDEALEQEQVSYYQVETTLDVVNNLSVLLKIESRKGLADKDAVEQLADRFDFAIPGKYPDKRIVTLSLPELEFINKKLLLPRINTELGEKVFGDLNLDFQASSGQLSSLYQEHVLNERKKVA